MSARPPGDNDNQPAERRRRERRASPEAGSSFGSFVSDSVRRSAGRFRGEEEEPRPARTRRRAEGTVRQEAAEEERFGVPRRRERRAYAPPPEDTEPEYEELAEAGSPRPVWMQEAIDRAGSPERALAAVAIAALVLVALIWLLVSVLGGDDNGGGGEPTATEVMQVVPIGDTATPPPGAGPGRGIVTPTPTAGGAVTPTPTSQGSDNVLDQVPSSPEAGAAPSVACSETCLARVERTPEASALLLANGTRPSYTGDEWYWIVAKPESIGAISAALETEVLRESADTLRLYMVTLPAPGEGDWAAWEVGEVIDQVGTYRLVEAPKAPANVEVAVDAGLTVEKLAPAPLEMRQRAGGLPELAESDIGGMTNDIDAGRLETTIAEMQAMGAADGSNTGTRHYRTTGNQVAAEYLFQKLESYGLNVWYEDFVSWDGLLLVSVVGEIPGRDTNRLYGVMAHFDTISEDPAAVAPGADDNATGVAATLEIARILSEFDLKYSLRFIFVNYEEEGVVGSQEFARDAVASSLPWEGIFNIDSIGSSRNGNQIVLNAGGESIWMQELLQRVNSAYGLDERLEIVQSTEIVADDSRLRSEGIQSVLVARELFGWSPLHHTERDVIENVSIGHTQRAGMLVLLTVAHLMI